MHINQNKVGKLILTDCEKRKVFDLYAIAREEKIPVVLFSTKSFFIRLLLSIAYFKPVFCQHRVTDLSANSKNIYVYFPVEESTVIWFYDIIINAGIQNIHFLLPQRKIFDISRSKDILKEFLKGSDVPVPKKYSINELEENREESNFNVVLKPKIGSGSRGIAYFNSYYEIKNYIKEYKINLNSFFIEEFIPHDIGIIGAFCLCVDGEIKLYYGHKRIVVYPETGGVTVVSKSIYHQETKNLAQLILAKMNWNGIVMLEFIYDKRVNQYKLIEINPRAWGSFLLSQESGMHFLKNYFLLSLKQPMVEVKFKSSYIRWLIMEVYINLFKEFSPLKFLSFPFKNTVFINFSYSNILSSIYFNAILVVFKLFKIEKS
jgi:hypothetical protein